MIFWLICLNKGGGEQSDGLRFIIIGPMVIMNRGVCGSGQRALLDSWSNFQGKMSMGKLLR